MANSLASSILTLAYGLMKVDSTTVSTPGLQIGQMLSYLSHANTEWIRTFVRSGGEPPKSIERETALECSGTVATVPALAAGASQVSFSSGATTDFASAGAGVIWGQNGPDVFEFTSKTSSTLDGVSGIDAAYDSAAAVDSLLALPSNFGSFRTSDDSPDGVTLNTTPLRYTSGTPVGLQFSVYDNGTTKYLMPSRGTTGTIFVRFNKAAATIDDASDTVDVPPAYEWFLVYRLAAQGHRIRGEEDRAQYCDAKADEILLQSQLEKNVGKIVRTRPFNRMRSLDPYLTNFR